MKAKSGNGTFCVYRTYPELQRKMQFYLLLQQILHKPLVKTVFLAFLALYKKSFQTRRLTLTKIRNYAIKIMQIIVITARKKPAILPKDGISY